MKKEGFTLVEIIVVAVIVVVLALIGVQIYQGYVQESRQMVIENTAGSAATYLNTAVNLGIAITKESFESPLTDAGTWVTNTEGGNSSLFRAPAGVIVTINTSSKSVTASMGEHTSDEYKYE